MAIVPYPALPEHQQVSLRPAASVAVSQSNLTRKRQASDLGYSWWEGECVVNPMKVASARKWRLFFGRVRGSAHSFRIPVLGTLQHTGTFTVRANGAGSGYSLATDGWPVSSTPLLAGDMVTVGDQLMTLDTDVVANASGQAVLQFHAPLRGTVSDNIVVETKDPFMLAYLPDGSPALTLGLADIQAGFSFAFEEAY